MVKTLALLTSAAVLALVSLPGTGAMGDEPDPVPMFSTLYFLNGQVVGWATDQCVAPYTVVTNRGGIETADSVSFPLGDCGADPNNIP